MQFSEDKKSIIINKEMFCNEPIQWKNLKKGQILCDLNYYLSGVRWPDLIYDRDMCVDRNGSPIRRYQIVDITRCKITLMRVGVPTDIFSMDCILEGFKLLILSPPTITEIICQSLQLIYMDSLQIKQSEL
jgi:hypothetical protein